MARYRLIKKETGFYDLSAALSSRSGLIWRGTRKRVPVKDVGSTASALGELVREQRVKRGMVPDSTGLPGRPV